ASLLRILWEAGLSTYKHAHANVCACWRSDYRSFLTSVAMRASQLTLPSATFRSEQSFGKRSTARSRLLLMNARPRLVGFSERRPCPYPIRMRCVESSTRSAPSERDRSRYDGARVRRRRCARVAFLGATRARRSRAWGRTSDDDGR